MRPPTARSSAECRWAGSSPLPPGGVRQVGVGTGQFPQLIRHMPAHRQRFGFAFAHPWLRSTACTDIIGLSRGFEIVSKLISSTDGITKASVECTGYASYMPHI